MAEFTSAEKVNIEYENEYSTDAMTGGPDKRRQLYYQLIQSMKKAESVDIIVSFLMESEDPFLFTYTLPFVSICKI